MRARIGRTLADSTPAFPAMPRPPAGAPNVMMIVLDDLGFAQLGCFGSDIDTPAIDGLAAGGLRFNRFHVTALCSPTRACLLTGRNHHAVGMGFLTDIPTGFPGYDGRIPRTAATLPRHLRNAGYNTFAVGKWHLTPRWEQSAAGPFDRWPLGLGFERYYGFLAGDTNQWTPELILDNGSVPPPRTPAEGYHLTEDLADTAIRWILDQQHAAPGRPFFLYFAPGATHAPHHVAPAWSDRHRGRFDDGWEAWRARTFERQRAAGIVPPDAMATERPSWVPAWETLSPEARRVAVRMMEVFAGFLSHTDAQIGRVLGLLSQQGLLENTLVLLLSDNGASAEGGPTGLFNEHSFLQDLQVEIAETAARIDEIGGFRSYNHYPWGWAWAGNTPFRLWKRFTWLGGVRTPLVVHWPRRIAAGGAIRTQFCHAIDLLPTVLEAIGIEPPAEVDGVAQLPIDGASLLPAFDDAGAACERPTQYFEMVGSRAIYHDGWKATTDHVGDQLAIERALVPGSHDFDADRWSLFDLRRDFSEAVDRSAEEPERLRKLVELWWAEAGRNQVLPIEDSFLGRTSALVRPPEGFRWRAELRPGGGPVHEEALPPMLAGFVLHAEIELPAGTHQGVLAALGDWSNGWACYLLAGRPVVTLNLFGVVHRIAGSEILAPGPHTLRFEFTREGKRGGRGRLAVDERPVAEAPIPSDLPLRWQIGGAGLLVGRDRGFPVCDDYTPPFPFTGTLHRLVLEAPPFRPRDTPQELARALRHE